MHQRENIQFKSGETYCSGWFYQGEGVPSDYYIVMAHGLAGIKEMRLDAYAEKFCAAGYRVLCFDYRNFGESGGSPRQLLDISRQQEDWAAAIEYVCQRENITRSQIVLWGTSLSGGHVIEVAARMPELAAVIAQVPHISGFAGATAGGLSKMLKLTWAGLKDKIRAALGLAPFYVDVCGQPGDLALLTAEEAIDYFKLVPDDVEFDRRVAARIALAVGFYNPGSKLKKLDMPVLVQVGLKDQTTPPGPAIKACANLASVTLATYDLGHFEPYLEPAFTTVVADQLSFLARILLRRSTADPAAV